MERRAIAIPTKTEIRSFWAALLCSPDYGGKFDSPAECLEADYCFACGMLAETERVRIKDKGEGPTALHLLCRLCQVAAGGRKGPDYFRWFRASSIMQPVAALNRWRCSDRARPK